MQSREGLHKLVDSMPEAAIETAHQFLLALQVWPPRPPVDAGKKIMMTEVRTAAGTRRRHMRGFVACFLAASHVAASALIWIWRFVHPSEFGPNLVDRGIGARHTSHTEYRVYSNRVFNFSAT